jgi:hypothetical protein
MRVGGLAAGIFAMAAMLAGVLPSDAFGLAVETIVVTTTEDHTLAEPSSTLASC